MPMGVTKGYLLGYNSVQLIGWIYTLILYFTESIKTNQWTDCSYDIEIFLRIFQTLSILEIVHALCGIVKSSPLTTSMQIFSRLLVIWGIIYLLPETRTSVGLALIILSWCPAEIIRYVFYVLTLSDLNLFFVTWLRYSAFIVLYPTGIFGEVLLIMNAIQRLRETGKYSYELPNPLNCNFVYWVVLTIILLIYIPASRVMYTHMLKQRKKSFEKIKIK